MSDKPPDVAGLLARAYVRRALSNPLLRELVEMAKSEMDLETEPAGRGPGRPRWTVERFHARYRAAIAKIGPEATEEEIAMEFRIEPRWLRRLVKRMGRPRDLDKHPV